MEPFYAPPIPRMRRQRGTTPVGGSTTYQFRQPQTQLNPLAVRRLDLQNVISQRREDEAAGRQELEAMKEMARLEQQEYKIRQDITTQRQVSSAQREVAKLDPLTDPNYQQKYADVMSQHPLAQDNKFLNEAFTAGTRANYRVAQHNFTALEEGQKQAGREDLAWIKASGAYAAMGGDPSTFTDKDGNHDWNALNAAHAKAVQVTKAAGEAANAGLPIAKTVTKEGDTTVTREDPKPDKPELTAAQKIGVAKLEGTLAGQLAQQQIFEKQMSDPDQDVSAQAKKNHAMVTANLAVTQGQVDAIHKAVTPTSPPADQVGPPPEMFQGAPPAATPPPVTGLSDEDKAGMIQNYGAEDGAKRIAGVEANLGGSPVLVAEPGAVTGQTDVDKAAIGWAAANPDDPRAAKIKAMHGLQ